MSGTKLALVTGASSGIGRAYARRLAANGHDLIVVARRADRLAELAAEFPDVNVRAVSADLSTDEGITKLSGLCEQEPLTMLVNNAGVANYMAFTDLSAEKASELLRVKVFAPTLLSRAAAAGMVARGGGTIVNVAGMLAFAGPAPLGTAAGRATYVGTLAHLVAFSQALNIELSDNGLRVQVLCPGIVATELHERQGMDLSALPRMTPEDVVTGSLRGLDLGEIVCSPGVEDEQLLAAVSQADLAAFAGQKAELAARYRG